MSAIKYDTNNNFPFQDLHLANPTGLQGGAYFSKLKLTEKKVIVQMPKCETKNGIHRTGKKIYTDLMFHTNNETFAEWIHNLSTRVKSLIYDKKDIWFQNEMTYDDIEYHWQNILRTYKKNNVLLRCIIKKPRNINRKELVMVYDEDENIISLEDIKSDSPIIPLLEITGLKFTTQSFLLEFALKQVMVLNETNGDECLISVTKPNPMVATIIPKQDPTLTPDAIEPTSPNNAVKTTDTLEINNESTKKNDLKKEEGEVNENLDMPSTESNKQTSLGNLEVTKDKKIDENMANKKENVILEIIPFVKQNDEDKKVGYLEKNTGEDTASTNSNTLEKKDINEIKLEYPEDGDMIALKKPDEVYLAIYKEAKRKAKEFKRAAIQAYLEVKRIKNKYMLDEIESSDDEFEMDTYE